MRGDSDECMSHRQRRPDCVFCVCSLKYSHLLWVILNDFKVCQGITAGPCIIYPFIFILSSFQMGEQKFRKIKQFEAFC